MDRDVRTTTRRAGAGSVMLIAVLMLAETNHAFEQNMVSIALPHLYADFGDPVAVGWSITGYALVAAATAATAGRLGDVLGRRMVLAGSLLLGTVGSFVVVFWPTLAGLITGRAIQGFTGAILGLAFGIARERMGEARAGQAISLLAGTALVGGTLGQLIAGTMLDRWGWHSMFYFSAALALMSTILAVVVVPPSPRRGTLRDVDFLGGTLFAVIITLLLLAFTVARAGATGRVVGSLLAAAVVIGALFSSWSLRHRNPAIDLRAFRVKRVAIAHAAMLVASLGVMSTFVSFSVALQTPSVVGIGFGATALVTSLFMGIPSLIGGGVFSPLSGRLARRYGAGVSMLLGASIVAVGSVTLLLTSRTSIGLPVGIAFTIFGVGALYAAIPVLLLRATPEERTSEAGNLNQVVKAVGLAVGPILVSALLATNVVQVGQRPFPAPSAHTAVFMLSTVAAALLIVLSLVAIRVERGIPRREGGTAPDPVTDTERGTTANPVSGTKPGAVPA
jgi:MFS family permease